MAARNSKLGHASNFGLDWEVHADANYFRFYDYSESIDLTYLCNRESDNNYNDDKYNNCPVFMKYVNHDSDFYFNPYSYF